MATVGALSIPVVCSIAINNVAVSTSDGVIGTRNDNRIKVGIQGGAEALYKIIRYIIFESSERHELTVVPAKVTVAPV